MKKSKTSFPKDHAVNANIPEMEEVSMPLFCTRNFKGYFQVIEAFEYGTEVKYYWLFYIRGFTSDDMGYILKWDQTHELVQFDQYDRVLVDGKYYNRKYWNH